MILGDFEAIRNQIVDAMTTKAATKAVKNLSKGVLILNRKLRLFCIKKTLITIGETLSRELGCRPWLLEEKQV